MSWQNWVVSRMVCDRIKKPTRQEPFDLVTTRLHAEKRKISSPVELPPDWRIVPADGVNGDGPTGEWIEPVDPNLHDDVPVAFYLHGGGYFFYSPRTHRPITIGLAIHARARVCTPGYRLASEHPSPAPVKDALFMYRALMTQGVPPPRIVVAGGSAGDGLALVLLVVLRDAADPLSADAVLYSPWTDLATTGQSLVDNDEPNAMFRDVWMTHGAMSCLDNSGALADHPLVSPLYADFTGLSTLHCYVNTSEVLRDDTLRMVEWARAVRVSISVEMG